MKLLRSSIWVGDDFRVNIELVGLDPGNLTKRYIRFELDADTARAFEDRLHHEVNMALRNEPRRAG